jgi:hypothetical protein
MAYEKCNSKEIKSLNINKTIRMKNKTRVYTIETYVSIQVTSRLNKNLAFMNIPSVYG